MQQPHDSINGDDDTFRNFGCSLTNTLIGRRVCVKAGLDETLRIVPEEGDHGVYTRSHTYAEEDEKHDTECRYEGSLFDDGTDESEPWLTLVYPSWFSLTQVAKLRPEH